MKIIVIVPLGEESKSYTSCFIQLLREIYPDHDLTEQIDLAAADKYSQNAIIIIKTTNRSSFSVWWWCNIVLRNFAAKVQPQLIVHLNGCCGMSVPVAQIIGFNDIAYLEAPEKTLNAWKKFSRKNLPVFLKKANRIITYSNGSKNVIAEKFGVNASDINIIPPAANKEDFQPLQWGEKQLHKLEYTDAKEFFLVSRNFREIDEVIFVLKAFSVFKKWQQSSMKLVIAGKLLVGEKEWQQKLSGYKFKNDVIVLDKLNDYYYAKVLASAYAFIHLPVNASDIIPALEAVYSRTPVISFKTEMIEEMMNDSFLLSAEDDFNELGQKMILLHKDETLRDKMIDEAEKKAEDYKREDVRQKLTKMIEQTLKNKITQ